MTQIDEENIEYIDDWIRNQYEYLHCSELIFSYIKDYSSDIMAINWNVNLKSRSVDNILSVGIEYGLKSDVFLSKSYVLLNAFLYRDSKKLYEDSSHNTIYSYDFSTGENFIKEQEFIRALHYVLWELEMLGRK
jgi:hypothetical protein